MPQVKNKSAPKGTKRPIHQYTEESLNKALKAIAEDGMPIRKACRNFGIHRGTVQDRIHRRIMEKSRKMGPDTILTHAEAGKLSEWLITLARVGFGRKKRQFIKYGAKNCEMTEENLI